MSKNNKILISVFTFIVVCVVGYALFSENITVTGSATASGDWGIAASCSDTIPAEVQEDYAANDIQGGFADDSCTVSGNTITSKATLLYPTAMKLHHAEYKNTGSVSAVFKMGKYENYPLDDAFSNPSNLSIKLDLYDKKTDELYQSYTDSSALKMENYGQVYIDKLYIKTADGHYLNYDEELLANETLYKDSEGNYYLEIKPGESIVFIISENWYKRAEQTDYYSKMEIKLNMNIIQKTDDLIKQTEADYIDLCLNHC